MYDDIRAEADPSFDRIARIVQDSLRVPVALVSLVRSDRQVFPGAAGLSEPWQQERQTPLTHSVCQYVVADAAPLLIEDTREDPRLVGNGAVDDLKVIAYAGAPLYSPDGEVIGSVCAIDSEPRAWTAEDLALLTDLAALCATELEIRSSRASLRASIDIATMLTQRARLLLSLSEALAETLTVADIAAALHDVVAKNLDCIQAGIWLIDGEDADTMRFVADPQQHWPQAESEHAFEVNGNSSIARVLLDRQPVFDSGDDADAVNPAALRFDPVDPDGRDPGPAQAYAIMPLYAAGNALGTSVLVWQGPRHFSDDDRVTLAALTSYTAQAVSRAALLAERTSVAHTLQAALLPRSLPQPDHLDIAARYLAAAQHDLVGGDWYDCVVMPSGDTHLMVGDVEGHDIRAAAMMGTLRNMLRALAWASEEPPSESVARLDRAGADLGLRPHATLVLARIERAGPAGAGRLLRWANAGHPPPVLVLSDGTCRVLDDDLSADCMIGVAPGRRRHDQVAELPTGSTLVLYTDGLIESDDHDIDLGLLRLQVSLARHHHLPAQEMIDHTIEELVGSAPSDDVAVLAVRFNPER